MGFSVCISIFFLGILSLVCGESCIKPHVTASYYTTQDATVLTNIAFITEFTVKCSNGVTGTPFHAQVLGKTLPAVRINDENMYQVSWIDDPTKASTGDYKVAIYDDEGYGALRKAMRNGEDVSSVKPLFTVLVSFPGAYQGPWVNSEFMAAVLSALVWYLAFSAKTKLLA